jgi:hypothetical protein
VKQVNASARGLQTHGHDGQRIADIVVPLACGLCAEWGELQGARGGGVGFIMARARACVGINVDSIGSAPPAHFECSGNTDSDPSGSPSMMDSVVREYRFDPPAQFQGGAVRAHLSATANLSARLELDNSNERILGSAHGDCPQPPVASACAQGGAKAACAFGLANLNVVAGSLEFTQLMTTDEGARKRRGEAREESGSFCTGPATTSTSWGGTVSISQLSMGLQHSCTRAIGGTTYASTTLATMNVQCYLCMQLPNRPSSFTIRIDRSADAQASIVRGRFAEAQARVALAALAVTVQSDCASCSEPPFTAPDPDSMGGG